jgi:osmoprotectant transport system substrate-binding protein
MGRIQALVLTVLVALGGCSSGPRRIAVGSKNFTEQLVLGEIVAAQLERKLGQPVDRKLNLGGTLLASIPSTRARP